MQKSYPILEYDSEPTAYINPHNWVKPNPDVPPHCVICFFQDVIDHLREKGVLTEITSQRSEMGKHPVYLFSEFSRPVAVFHPGVGAPLAAGLLEEIIALGAKKFIVCGGAGVLDSATNVGALLVPISAIRDEGTSYHYLQPAREVYADENAVAAIEATLAEKKIIYRLGKTWTTDAIYRETRAKIALRKSEGCECVEMEAAALFAVAQFRQVALAQILYAGDSLGGEYWDGRKWQDRWEVRRELLYLAVEACLKLS